MPMGVAKQIAIWTAVWVVLFVGVSLSPGQFLHRQAFDRAFSEWRRNPTPATEAELRHQQWINDVHWFVTDGTIALVLVAIGAGLGYSARKLGGKGMPPSPPASD